MPTATLFTLYIQGVQIHSKSTYRCFIEYQHRKATSNTQICLVCRVTGNTIPAWSGMQDTITYRRGSSLGKDGGASSWMAARLSSTCHVRCRHCWRVDGPCVLTGRGVIGSLRAPHSARVVTRLAFWRQNNRSQMAISKCQYFEFSTPKSKKKRYLWENLCQIHFL